MPSINYKTFSLLVALLLTASFSNATHIEDVVITSNTKNLDHLSFRVTGAQSDGCTKISHISYELLDAPQFNSHIVITIHNERPDEFCDDQMHLFVERGYLGYLERGDYKITIKENSGKNFITKTYVLPSDIVIEEIK
jgi:hypothetical protein